MSVNQVSVFLENKPGTLNKLTEVLAANKINIRALSLAETSEFGIVRMLVNDVFEATTVLKENNFVATHTPVLAYAIEDKAGDLNSLLNKFTEIGVNIEYMYAFTARQKSAYAVFRVDNCALAEENLQANGIAPLQEGDLQALLEA